MKKGLIKNVLIIITVLIIVVIAYVVIQNQREKAPARNGALVSESGNVSIVPDAENSEVIQFSNELVILLGSVQNITLNDSIFYNPAFMALRDISIPLLREGNEGRPNPFSPIPGFENATTSTTAKKPANQFSAGVTTTPISSTTTQTTTTTATQADPFANEPEEEVGLGFPDDYSEQFGV